MQKRAGVAPQTRNNWLIDFTLFTGAVIASITGIYFLFLPVGGYQGGRNPMYGIVILFERHTWEDLHTWFGILMIAAALVHVTLHWRWFLRMFQRLVREIIQRDKQFNSRSRVNLLVNVAVALGFILAASSGVYLLFVPGGRNAVPDPHILFSRTTWDLIHTWSGILMIAAAVVHFAIHWKWVTKVTRKIFLSLRPVSRQIQISETNNA
jgi:NADH:ubiquinone oxidoreductase subunit 5 (subunit L)/multisubunit Na+/H+ antiporter MnhA subunit